MTMLRRAFSLALLVVLVAALPGFSQPVQSVVIRNSFNPTGAGARGLGMGGAFIAVADDGTAASFNPAGLSQLRRSELALVGWTDELQSSLDTPGRQKATNKNRHQSPDFLGLAVPFELSGRNL